MHSLFKRFYTILNLAIPSVISLLIGAYLLSALEPQKGDPVCSVENVALGDTLHVDRSYYEDPHDRRPVVFDLDCDVAPLWHWNTKMLYIHLKASFVDKNGAPTSLTIWDRRISSSNEAHISLKEAISDPGLISLGLYSMPDTIEDMKLSISVSETPFGGKMRYYDVYERTLPLLPEPPSME